jgi:hypothetical protein
MREFYLTLDSCFKNGLRPVKGMASSPLFMSYLLNGRPTETGLEPYTPLNSYTTQSFDWPYPQIFRGRKYTLMGTRTGLYELRPEGWVLIFSDPEEDDPWDFMDFGGFMVVMRRENRIFVRNSSVLYGGPVDTMPWQIINGGMSYPSFKTGCDFKGQMIIGNLKFDIVRTGAAQSYPGYIMASKVGRFEFKVRDGDQHYSNDVLFRQVHWNGVVHRVRRLEDLVIIYGDEGGAALYPADKYLGYKELPIGGIYSPRAIDGSLHRHVFLGHDQKLYSIDPQGQVKLLDFYESMSTLGQDVIISYNEAQDEFFIGDGVRSFVLRGEKLYECYQLVASSMLYGADTLASKYDTNKPYFLGVTDSFDFGYRSLKTIMTVELGVESDGDYSVAIDWRNSAKDAFTRTAFVPVNSEGVATIPTSGLQFRLCIKCDDYRDVHISYATIRYKMTDMRTMRGVYAPPPRGQD